MIENNIAVAYTSESLKKAAEKIAVNCQLPLVKSITTQHFICLVLTPDRLELHAASADAPGPIFVDFISGKMAHRRRFGGGRRQLIGRAVGIKSGKTLNVLDVTAGLGRDAYVLACLGCRVTMLERSPVIAALLQDGLMRAATDTFFKTLDFQLIQADAKPYLQFLSKNAYPDVIYLDPMFTPLKKSALVKKEMRLLKSVVGEDDNAVELLALALKIAKQRVVVKRHRHAPAISGPKPSLVFEGKSTRFDVYLTI